MSLRKWKKSDETLLKVVEDRLTKKVYETETERIPKDFGDLQSLESEVEIPATFVKRVQAAKVAFSAFLKPAAVNVATVLAAAPAPAKQTPEERIAEIRDLVQKQPEIYRTDKTRRARNLKFVQDKIAWIAARYKETDDPANARKPIGKDPKRRLKILRESLQKLEAIDAEEAVDAVATTAETKNYMQYLRDIRDRLNKNAYRTDEAQRATNIQLLKRKMAAAAKRREGTGLQDPEMDKAHTDLLDALEKYEDSTDLLKEWEEEEDFDKRNALLAKLQSRGLEPSNWTDAREQTTGLYPNIQSASFASRLAQKAEFADLRSKTTSEDVCGSSGKAFDTTPVQRLVARFLHPKTPYKSLLLDHGVGVGKTCTAITVAEAFLDILPQRKVIILCPQAIASGFRRTLFDPEKLMAIPPREAQLRGEVWESFQCTGMTYLRLTDTQQERDIQEVTKQVTHAINKRYNIMGYLAFANKINKKLKKHIPKYKVGEERTLAENAFLYKYFSDRLLIVDEAHNLRDAMATVGPSESESEAAGNDGEGVTAESPNPLDARDAAEGKQLTPLLKRILHVAEGLRLLMMTATPMYNTAPEILFLLNLMILNDTKDEGRLLQNKSFFAADGSLLPSAHAELQTLCGRYISYMRGENPASFPLRLTPPTAAGPTFFTSEYPTLSTSKREDTVKMTEATKTILGVLPIVVHKLNPDDSVVGRELHKAFENARAVKEEKEISDLMLGQIMQMSNITYPDGTNGSRGWELYWKPQVVGKTQQFQWTPPEDQKTLGVDAVFGPSALKTHAPKMAAVVESLRSAQGMCFVFSQFVKAGALPMAVALERAGWTRVLADGSAAPLVSAATKVAAIPRQCALCPHKENQTHTDHTFMPANFVLLTGSELITPDFRGTLAYANTLRTSTDILGGKVKAILGSQVASEGLDLKCIRENHILDSWYHLNRIEQIIGRAVRYCSHVALPMEQRNCTIYMHCVSIPTYETADLYAYRLASRKAIPMGAVQRLIKIGAWDCLMNRDAILLKGLRKRRVVTAQGQVLESYDPHDKPHTSICDFQETCEYQCAAKVETTETNTSTYEVLDARRRFQEKEALLRKLFAKEIALPLDFLKKTVYGDMPWEIGSIGLRSTLQNPTFIIQRTDGARGTLELKNGYIVFRPLGVTDPTIPLALRYGKAFGRVPRTYQHDPLLELEEIVPVPLKEVTEKAKKGVAKAKVAVETDEAKAQISDAEAPEAPEAIPKLVSEALQSLATWKDLLETLLTTDLKTAIRPPSELPKPFFEGFRWVLHHFAALPEIRQIAEKWWIDFEWSLQQREAVLKYLLTQSDADADPTLLSHFRPVELFRGAISGYHTLHLNESEPAKSALKTYCALDEGVTECPTILQKEIQSIVGKPVDRYEDTGPLFGFLIPIKNNVVFKSVDKKEKITGAQCANTSNLAAHHSRIEQIQQELGSFMEGKPIMDIVLGYGPDETSAAERKARQESGKLQHVKDLTKIHSCLYMEVLLRWMDLQRVGGKRWFLPVVDAVRAGYKPS